MLVLILFALLSGFVTVLSPCILPVLPIVLSSSAGKGKARPIGVISGLVISFSIFTLAISQIISLLGISASALRLLAVAVLILIGLTMVVPALNLWIEKLFSYLPNLASKREQNGSGFGPGFITGASLGLVWAPCAGPILAAVTALAATQALSFASVIVVIAYAIGAGVPLLAIAYGGRALIKRVPVLTRNLQRVQQIFGIIMIFTAGLIAFNLDTVVTTWLTGIIPSGWTANLSAFENSQAVNQGINQLNGQTSSTIEKPAMEKPQELPNMGPAPELTGINNWINSNPLTLESLKGKVVLIDFWTYSCINCIRTLPYVTDWYNKYKDQGFVVIGVHTPEFAFEKETNNVEDAVARFKIDYPVAQDNDFKTWRAFNNSYWPAEYFIDVNGNIRHTHFGEGKYDESEKIIQQLLLEGGKTVSAELTQQPLVSTFSPEQTKETYIGSRGQQSFASPETVMKENAASYSLPADLPLHNFAVSGTWKFTSESAQASEAGAILKMHFNAKDVYLVMTADQPTQVRVTLDTPNTPNRSKDLNAQGEIVVSGSRLYHLIKMDALAEGTVTLQFDQPGVNVYAFTFGG